jgi:hypothetical protein
MRYIDIELDTVIKHGRLKTTADIPVKLLTIFGRGPTPFVGYIGVSTVLDRWYADGKNVDMDRQNLDEDSLLKLLKLRKKYEELGLPLEV